MPGEFLTEIEAPRLEGMPGLSPASTLRRCFREPRGRMFSAAKLPVGERTPDVPFGAECRRRFPGLLGRVDMGVGFAVAVSRPVFRLGASLTAYMFRGGSL